MAASEFSQGIRRGQDGQDTVFLLAAEADAVVGRFIVKAINIVNGAVAGQIQLKDTAGNIVLTTPSLGISAGLFLPLGNVVFNGLVFFNHTGIAGTANIEVYAERII